MERQPSVHAQLGNLVRGDDDRNPRQSQFGLGAQAAAPEASTAAQRQRTLTGMAR